MLLHQIVNVGFFSINSTEFGMIVIDTDSASSLIIVKVSAEVPVVFTTLTTVAESKVVAEVFSVGTGDSSPIK